MIIRSYVEACCTHNVDLGSQQSEEDKLGIEYAHVATRVLKFLLICQPRTFVREVRILRCEICN